MKADEAKLGLDQWDAYEKQLAEEREKELAATRLQARMRGKNARRQRGANSSGVEEVGKKKAAKKGPTPQSVEEDDEKVAKPELPRKVYTAMIETAKEAQLNSLGSALNVRCRFFRRLKSRVKGIGDLQWQNHIFHRH